MGQKFVDTPEASSKEAQDLKAENEKLRQSNRRMFHFIVQVAITVVAVGVVFAWDRVFG